MNLAELQEEVISLTARPDLVAQTLRAVRSATQRAHSLDYWRRDLTEVAMQFDAAEFLQAANMPQLLSNFRSLKYLRKADGSFIELIEPEEIFNYFNNLRNDVCYMAGDVLQIRSSTAVALFSLGYYRHPNVTEEGWDSWIGSEFPEVITHYAAALICRQIGYQEMAADFERSAKEFYLVMQRTAVDALGN